MCDGSRVAFVRQTKLVVSRAFAWRPLLETRATARVQKSTLEGYLKHLNRFAVWLLLNSLRVITVTQLDDLVVEYGETLCATRGDFIGLLSALFFVYPKVKGRLVASCNLS